MKTKTWLWALLLAVIALAGAGVYLLHGSEGTVATVWLDGACIRTIDLAAVAAPYEFDIESEYGVNTVRVSHGEIAVVRADCPEQICVNQGTISSSAIPITCLPHRLVIQIEDE